MEIDPSTVRQRNPQVKIDGHVQMSAKLFARHTSAKCVKLRIFFPRASERRLLPIEGSVKHLLITAAHLHILTSSHLWNLVSCERVARDDLDFPFHLSFFGDQISFRVKGLRRTTLEIAILPQFLAIEPFRAKGSRGTTWKSQFCLSFGDRTSFRAKALLGTDIPSRLALPLPRRE